MSAPITLALASLLAAGPGLGTDRIAAAVGPEAPPPTAAESQPETDAEAPAEDGGGEDGGGWDDEDSVPVDSEDTAPTAEPAPEQPVAPATPAAGDPAAPGTVLGGSGIVKKPAPAPDNKKGLGLIIASGAVGAVAWGMAAAQAGIIAKSCVTGDETVDDAGTTITGCVTQAGTFILLTAFKWIPNSVTYGLAPGAGIVRGRWEAQDHAYSGNHDRNGTVFIAAGGAALGVGLIGKIVMWGLIPRTFACPIDPIDEYGPCVRRRFAGYFLGQQFLSSSIAAGAGLLAFGIYYNKERAAREKLFFRPDQVRLIPNVTREFAGASLAGRF
ncbi:MAG: hypothetical protein AAF721_29615 [Myxococcota bacterium]